LARSEKSSRHRIAPDDCRAVRPGCRVGARGIRFVAKFTYRHARTGVDSRAMNEQPSGSIWGRLLEGCGLLGIAAILLAMLGMVLTYEIQRNDDQDKIAQVRDEATRLSAEHATHMALQTAQIEALTNEVRALKDEIRSLTASDAAKAAEVSRLQSRIGDLIARTTVLQDQVAAQSGENAALHRQIEEATAQIVTLQGQLSSAQNRVSATESALASTQDDLFRAKWDAFVGQVVLEECGRHRGKIDSCEAEVAQILGPYRQPALKCYRDKAAAPLYVERTESDTIRTNAVPLKFRSGRTGGTIIICDPWLHD
jgi:cell division protein FtsB